MLDIQKIKDGVQLAAQEYPIKKAELLVPMPMARTAQTATWIFYWNSNPRAFLCSH